MVDIRNYLEHTVLKADTSATAIRKLCQEAATLKLFGVCVPSFYVPLAKSLLLDSNVKLVTVVGFPMGWDKTATKVKATEIAVTDGADEIDMVLNISAMKDQNFTLVKSDIAEVVRSAQGRMVKVIIETCALTNDEKRIASEFCVEAGAHFVKTSTGFGSAGAKVEDVALIQKTVGSRCRIKASGGIRDLDFCRQLITAGADRIGTSSSVDLIAKQEQPLHALEN